MLILTYVIILAHQIHRVGCIKFFFACIVIFLEVCKFLIHFSPVLEFFSPIFDEYKIFEQSLIDYLEKHTANSQ